jgi:hypothetical protein
MLCEMRGTCSTNWPFMCIRTGRRDPPYSLIAWLGFSGTRANNPRPSLDGAINDLLKIRSCTSESSMVLHSNSNVPSVHWPECSCSHQCCSVHGPILLDLQLADMGVAGPHERLAFGRLRDRSDLWVAREAQNIDRCAAGVLHSRGAAKQELRRSSAHLMLQSDLQHGLCGSEEIDICLAARPTRHGR